MAGSSLVLTDRRCEICREPMTIESQSQGKALTLMICPNNHRLFIDMHGLEVK